MIYNSMYLKCVRCGANTHIISTISDEIAGEPFWLEVKCECGEIGSWYVFMPLTLWDYIVSLEQKLDIIGNW